VVDTVCNIQEVWCRTFKGIRSRVSHAVTQGVHEWCIQRVTVR
jgi:hypothetical protein